MNYNQNNPRKSKKSTFLSIKQIFNLKYFYFQPSGDVG